MMTLTQVTRNILMTTHARYQLAIVSNVSEKDCHWKMQHAEQYEEMLPLTVVIAGGYKGDKIEDLDGNEYDYAIAVTNTGEVIDTL